MAQNRMKIDLRAEYTETESVCVYTEQKNNTNYIYIIVSVKKQARILRAGDRFSRKESRRNLSFS